MRVDPFIQLNEAITSILEAIAYSSTLVLAVILLVIGALKLRSRIRRPQRTSNVGARADARDRHARRGDRVAPAAR
jgi:hypothetical protein